MLFRLQDNDGMLFMLQDNGGMLLRPPVNVGMLFRLLGRSYATLDQGIRSFGDYQQIQIKWLQIK
jgi:hypothetical protein